MKAHFLDVGKTKYGDCILIERGGRTILVDGAHRRDAESIVSQLADLLSAAPPFAVDLLVVSHCHDDHLGCLPDLVAAGRLTAKNVLAVHADLGFGHDSDGASGRDDAIGPGTRLLIAALQEEDHSGLPDEELAQFLTDAATVESRYREMLKTLRDGGANVVPFSRDAHQQIRQLEKDFADFGLQVLGPTYGQLETCAQAIGKDGARITDGLAAVAPEAAAADPRDDASRLVDAYRRMMRPSASDDLAADAYHKPGQGAKNDQSIVLKLAADGWSLLLPGDMQFADPMVDGLDEEMESLLEAVNKAGPYDLIKTAHHTSDNGLDDVVFADWEGTPLFAHSGGVNDADHPNRRPLEVLKQHHGELTFARTDRNGQITVGDVGGRLTISKTTGRFNDFTPNRAPRRVADRARDAAAREALPTEGAAAVRWEATSRSGELELKARLPESATRLTITVDFEARD